MKMQVKLVKLTRGPFSVVPPLLDPIPVQFQGRVDVCIGIVTRVVTRPVTVHLPDKRVRYTRNLDMASLVENLSHYSSK